MEQEQREASCILDVRHWFLVPGAEWAEPWPHPHPGQVLQALGWPGLSKESGRWWEASHGSRVSLAGQGRSGFKMGPHSDGQKHKVKPGHIVSHPSYISDVWKGEFFKDPRRRRVFEPRGVRALDRRKWGAGRLWMKESTSRGLLNSLKNNVAFPWSRKYIQTLTSDFCIVERNRKGMVCRRFDNYVRRSWQYFFLHTLSPTAVSLEVRAHLTMCRTVATYSSVSVSFLSDLISQIPSLYL